MRILTNHIGYDTRFPKKAIIRSEKTENIRDISFHIVDVEKGNPVFKGKGIFKGEVSNWKNWFFAELDFSTLTRVGNYKIEIVNERSFYSRVFSIRKNILFERTVNAILDYFYSQRCSGIWDEADRHAPFYSNRERRVDVHGGWYDASGDKSKYLSHLSYANYLNPQQTPMVVWNFLEGLRLMIRIPNGEDIGGSVSASINLKERIAREALYGADFLLRMQDPAGYFYVTLFDRWSKEPSKREICAFEGQKGIKNDKYQAGYREGAGMAIAALARIYSMRNELSGLVLDTDTESNTHCSGPSSERDTSHDYIKYINAAVKGFYHLEKNNKKYLYDHRENIIDDYCSLMAATELYRATEKHSYLQSARDKVKRLVGRLSIDVNYKNWWKAGDNEERPYYHAAEAGLPVVALMNYYRAERDSEFRGIVADAVTRSLKFELEITNEVTNPFGYARQYVKPVNGEKHSSFFMPHENETGYWWQGENARLASLAVAALSSYEKSDNLFYDRFYNRFYDKSIKSSESIEQQTNKTLISYALDQLNWILGLNPFDTCMLHGFGYNNPEYEEKNPNYFGGICNGITGGILDESDIDFLPLPYAEQGQHRWRWSEQWIPHAAWYFLAVISL